ncbi:hypothetical protein JB92DRAFT_3112458 [Gautieria morchelliformis]|nr:hypothetical protein JB92DRAFT_3112458 [Gautieria morchelliformis]
MTDRGHGHGTQPGQGQASDGRNNPPPTLSSYERPPAGYLNELRASLGQNLSASSDNPGAAHPSVPRLPLPGHGQHPSASGNNPGTAHHSVPYVPRLRHPPATYKEARVNLILKAPVTTAALSTLCNLSIG